MTIWQKILDAIVSGNISEKMIPPYVKTLTLPMIAEWGERYVLLEWPVSETMHQGAGMVFGGFISALADYAAGSAMLTIIGDRDQFFTNNLEIEYKRPIRTGIIFVKAEIVSVEGSKVVVDVTFKNEKGDVYSVSRVKQTWYAPS